MIISSILLLAYCLSFAHNLIPHCHHAIGQLAIPHTHAVQHEHHEEGDHHGDENHTHIAHQGHLDEGLVDLLVCLLTETEHPGSDAGEHFVMPNTELHKLDISSKIQITSMLIYWLFDFSEDCTLLVARPEIHSDYTAPLLAHSPLRGPPTISC